VSTAELVLTDSAAIALMDEAERALAEVNAPEDAEELWRRIKAVEEAARLARLADVTVASFARVRLRAKRRWGELLGPADDKGGRPAEGETVTASNGSADRVQQHRARRLAAVPEQTFEAALTADDADKAPSEASVLRRAAGAVHFSSATDEWATPQDLFDQLDAEFNFELDVCALDSSAKCPTYFTPQTDGLSKDWKKFRCWMNPPYGDVIGDWMRKASEEAAKGAVVVCLLPARVDTSWWWDYCLFGEIRFLKGRLRFGNSKAGAPFPSAIVVLGPGYSPKVRWWER
jgi:phage N-6-adenine-methyltransferase